MFWGFKSHISHTKNGISCCQQNPCKASYRVWNMNQTSIWKSVFKCIFQFIKQENTFGWWDSNPQLFYPLKKHSTVICSTSLIKFSYTIAFSVLNEMDTYRICVLCHSDTYYNYVKCHKIVCNRPSLSLWYKSLEFLESKQAA